MSEVLLNFVSIPLAQILSKISVVNVHSHQYVGCANPKSSLSLEEGSASGTPLMGPRQFAPQKRFVPH